MKKILVSLVALVCSMSMNAQVMKVMKNGQDTPVETYYGSDYYVVLEEAPATTGTAVATIGGNEVNVRWVQLWAGGPKFAEYNVGVTDGNAESFGGLYCWGGSIDKDPNGAYKEGTDVLTDDDTATNLWGNAWRMPTKDELDALNELDANYNYTNCDVTWTYNYNGTGVKGRIYTGKGDFASNSIFLPAAGCFEDGNFQPLSTCFYWSSTPNSNDYSYYMYFGDGTYGANIRDTNRRTGYSVRAVLKEN